MWKYNQTEYLIHYGRGHLDGGHSGRYPWGSGKKRKEKDSVQARARRMSDEELDAYNKRAAKENQYVKNYKQREPEKKDRLKLAKDIVDESGKAVNRLSNQLDEEYRRQPKVVREDLSKMTDQELREKVNRAALEQQYVNYYGIKEVSRGREYVSRTLDTVGAVVGIAGTSLAIALAIKELRG